MTRARSLIAQPRQPSFKRRLTNSDHASRVQVRTGRIKIVMSVETIVAGAGARCRRLALGLAAIAGVAAAVASGAQSAGPVVAVARTDWHLPAVVYRTVASVADGRIYVLGGHDAAGGSITDVYALDPTSGHSSLAGTLALQTHGAAAATLAGRVLVFGGASSSVHNTVQWFKPPSGRTSVIGYMPRRRADVTAALVGKQVVLAGGFDGYGPQADVWATRDGRSFRVVARLPQPVRYPAVAVHGSDVYVFGGLLSGSEYNGTFTSDIQRIHLPTGTASIVSHLPVTLAHAMAATVAGQLLIAGGSTPTTTSAAVYRFNPTNNRISRVATLPAPLTDAAVATLGHHVYLLGGISGGRPLDTILRLTTS
ncbi:MAG: Kelch repeat-containing protein [Gaiellaceae bacterium]